MQKPLLFIKSILILGAGWLLLVQGPAARAQSSATAPADADRTAKIVAAFPVLDKLYADVAARQHVTGLAYGLVVDGQLVHTGAVGYTDAATKTPVTAQSVFRIASMTKSFVALAVLRLRDDGRLRLDDPA